MVNEGIQLSIHHPFRGLGGEGRRGGEKGDGTHDPCLDLGIWTEVHHLERLQLIQFTVRLQISNRGCILSREEFSLLQPTFQKLKLLREILLPLLEGLLVQRIALDHEHQELRRRLPDMGSMPGEVLQDTSPHDEILRIPRLQVVLIRLRRHTTGQEQRRPRSTKL